MRSKATIIGSVTTPIKRALVEMVKHGALKRERGIWKSCTGVVFFDQTIAAMVSRNLAIISVNGRYVGLQFVRLSQIGEYTGRGVLLERNAREAAQEAANRTLAELAELMSKVDA